MKDPHLDHERFALVLVGEEDEATKGHLASCLLCQKELAAWHHLEDAGRRWRPSQWRRWWVRQRVLWRLHPSWVWPVVAPAGLLVVALLVALLLPQERPVVKNAEAVLEQVDVTLSADPLSAFADAELVDMIVSESISGERSNS